MVFSFAGEVYKGSHKPLITKALYERVQEVMKDRSKPNRKRKRHFIFRGLMRCGECSAMITAEVQKGHIYYRCTKRKGRCSQRYIREEALTKQIRERLKEVAINKEIARFMSAELER